MADQRARRDAKRPKAGDGGSSSNTGDGGGSSNIERTVESQRPKETLLDAVNKRLREQPPSENQRANETLRERVERLTGERLRFLQEVDLHPSDKEAFVSNYIRDYNMREREKRGISKLDRYSLDEEKISEKCKISLECELITTGRNTMSLDEVTYLMTEDVVFGRTILGLNKFPPGRRSDSWRKFRVESYDNIIEKYKLDNHETRRIMLADIMQLERGNKSSVEQLNGKEYQTILKIVLKEWEDWKRDNNVTE
jgi:hypothetical protein